jgi:hypothetical protein
MGSSASTTKEPVMTRSKNRFRLSPLVASVAGAVLIGGVAFASAGGSDDRPHLRDQAPTTTTTMPAGDHSSANKGRDGHGGGHGDGTRAEDHAIPAAPEAEVHAAPVSPVSDATPPATTVTAVHHQGEAEEGDDAGECDEAEHAGDARCSGVPATTVTTEPGEDEHESGDLPGKCDEAEHAGDIECAESNGTTATTAPVGGAGSTTTTSDDHSGDDGSGGGSSGRDGGGHDGRD